MDSFEKLLHDKVDEIIKNSTFHVRLTDRSPMRKPHTIEILRNGKVESVTEEENWIDACNIADAYAEAMIPDFVMGFTPSSVPNIYEGEHQIWRKEYPHIETINGNFSKRCKCYDCKPNQSIDIHNYNYSVGRIPQMTKLA